MRFSDFYNLFLDWWVLFGLLAQGIFFMRFVVQWIFSELAGKAVIPMSFWYLSITGSVMILIYSVHRHDIVFIMATLFSMVIYIRNIVLTRRKNS